MKYLNENGFVNPQISGYEQFIDLIKEHVAEHTYKIDNMDPSEPPNKRKRKKKNYDQAIKDKALEYF